MKNKIDEIFEVKASLMHTVDRFLLKIKESISLLKDENAKQALTKVSELFETTITPLNAHVESKIKSINLLDESTKKIKNNVSKKNEYVNALFSSLKKNRDDINKKLKLENKPEIKKNKIKKQKLVEKCSHILLAPEKIREMIIQNLQPNPMLPRSTGNIWENWGKNFTEASTQTPNPQPKKEDKQ